MDEEIERFVMGEASAGGSGGREDE